MELKVGEKTIPVEHHPEIVAALWGVGALTGVIENYTGNSEDIGIKGRAVDLYLLSSVIAMRLAAGDLDLVEKGDSLHKKEYQEKLMAEVRRDWC